MTKYGNGAAARQLTLFAVEEVESPPVVSVPKHWVKFYRSWRGEFFLISERQRGKLREYQCQFTVFRGHKEVSCCEIIATSLDVVEQDFYDTVDRQLASHRVDNFGVLPFDAPEQVTQEHFTVLEQDTQKSIPEQKTPGYEPHTDVPEHIKGVPEQLQWVETYHPSKRKANYYYRYCFKQGRKIHHMHIAGGNTRSPLAQERKQMVESAIAIGRSPREISELIRSMKPSDKTH